MQPEFVAGYDIIGDIHGHIAKLERLLSKLGYREDDGVYHHPDRKVVFVGDFIDRGPDIPETMALVRRMVDGGSALAVLGNHELNALRYAVNGDPKLRDGLRNSLEQFANAEAEWNDHLDWFRTLPFFLELDGLRVIHAVWDDELIERLTKLRAQDEQAFWREALNSRSDPGTALDVLLNGWRLPLPGQQVVEEFEGSTRSFVRLAWWKRQTSNTYRGLSLPYDADVPDVPIPPEIHAALPAYGPNEPPLFLGHYALPPDLTPWPQADNVACVDYRAAKKGPLIAYRWDGEGKLDARKFGSSED